MNDKNNTDDKMADAESRKKIAEMFDDESVLYEDFAKEKKSEPSSSNNNTATIAPTIEPSGTYKERRFKKLKVAFIGLLLVALVFSGAYFVFYHFKKPAVMKNAEKNHAFTSPLGFLGLDSDKTKGKATFRMNGNEYTSDYFVVDGQLYLELIPHANLINDSLLELLNKNLPKDKHIDPADEAANTYTVSKYVKFNYSSLYGLDRLTEYNPFDLFSLYLPFATGEVKTDELLEKRDNNESLVKSLSSTACSQTARELNAYISDERLNTGLFTPKKEGLEVSSNRLKFELDNSKLDQLIPMLKKYIGVCLVANSKSPDSDREFYESIVKQYEKLPKVTVENIDTPEAKELKITVEYQGDGNLENPLHEISLIFERDATIDKEFGVSAAKNDSLNNRAVRYALAYEKCRFTPVVLSEFTRSYNYLISEKSYSYPSPFDSKYVCSTLDDEVETYRPSETLELDIGRGATLKFSGNGRDNYFQKYHDISHYIEAFYVKNKRYPSLDEINDNKVEGLKGDLILDSDNKKIGQGDINYKLLPNGCSKNCQNYEFSVEVYVPATNNTIILRHQGFDSDSQRN